MLTGRNPPLLRLILYRAVAYRLDHAHCMPIVLIEGLAMPQPPTGTVTFLFTDIEGSTRLWERDPDAMRPALARHDELISHTIEDHGGFVFKTVGDSFCAAFQTAKPALEAACAAQIALNAVTWDTQTPLLVRMALHTGVAEERGGDYFGQTLNRVARLMAAGHGAQVLLSDVTHEIIRDALPLDASLKDHGEHRLKDLGRPERISQLLHPALPTDFPPLKSLDNPALLNNLPQQVSSFVGRETQIAEIKDLLTRSRLLTLTGAGGCGKTRLSLQVAADLLDGSGDGVWFVELAPLSDPALVPRAVAGVLGVSEQPGQPMQLTLVEWLKPKRLLLILDNCEHLVAACAVLAADLLRYCPGVHFLCSSRELLGIPGERVSHVPSLSLPDLTHAQTVQSLSGYEAVALFVERAQAVQPSFAVTDANALAVARICRRLDGIPLALEMAAARVRSLTAEEINSRLDQRFRLLTGGSRTLLPRQQTLRALIDWSYDLLSAPEKTLLARLSVFAGGWTLDAAEAVCAGDPIEDWEVLDLLTGLIDKSLAQAEERGAGTRYRLLETVRQYAWDRLQESSEYRERQEQAASWFLKLAEEAEPQLRRHDGASWLTRLEAEHDNLRASLSWFEHSAQGAKAGLSLAATLVWFWQIRGHHSEGRRWLEKTLARPQVSESAAGFEALTIRSKALGAAGHLAESQGAYGEARTLLKESLAINRQLGHQVGIAASLCNLGNVADWQGDYAEARHLYEESLAIFRQLENQLGIALVLSNLGNVAIWYSAYAEARALYEESLAIHRQLGNEQGIGDVLSNLGLPALYAGDYAAAWALQQESLAIRRQLENPQGIANSLYNLGKVAARRGDYAESRALHKESLTIYRQMSNEQGIADTLEGIAAAACGLNQMMQAAQLWGAASSLRNTVGCLLIPVEKADLDIRIASARAVLGEEAFSKTWAAGKSMALEQAVERALSDVE